MMYGTMKLSVATTSLSVFLTVPLLVNAKTFIPPADLVKQKLQEKSLPDTGEAWTTLPNGIEYQPAANLSPLAQRHLRQLTSTSQYPTGEFEKMFVDGAETYYDEYAQAWRALGFYIDCGYRSDNARRGLKEKEEGCLRYMLWAAYVDEEYEGNGVGEYMYYDRKNDYWDPRACNHTQSTRCVKMDCHLSTTHFSLLGFFKEPQVDEWMGQLFKHEGDCVWTEEEYEFMQSSRDMLPDKCTSTGVTIDNIPLYYHIKPSRYGEIEIGVYTDTNCIQEYQGELSALGVMRQMVCGEGNDASDICATGAENYNDAYEMVYGSSNNGGDQKQQGGRNMWVFASNTETWNRAFDVYKQCQPCVTYDLTNFVPGENSEPILYEWTSAAVGDGGPDGDDAFQCSDAAGYDNVNQCMKFKTKTEMITATWTDVEMAVTQGSIATIAFPGVKKTEFSFTASVQERQGGGGGGGGGPSFLSAWIMLIVSTALFVASWFRLRSVQSQAAALEEPLISSKQGVSA